MNNKDIFRAFGSISDGLIDDSVKPPKGKKLTRILASAGALAACAALALGVWRVAGLTTEGTLPDTAGQASSDLEEQEGIFSPATPDVGVYIPPAPMPDSSSAGMASDMIGFFIYGGRMYTQTTVYVDDALRGDYVCTVTGDIDEWSGADEYVEGASSVAGDVYAVSGYDPDFRLCLSNGERLELYDCMSGITLTTGADLYSERLHIERAESAYCIPDADWEQGVDARRELSLSELEPFLATLMAAPMQDWGRGSKNGDIYYYDYAEAHLYFTLDDGTTVPLRLFENGCVIYDGSAVRVCAYMPGAIFDAVFEACT